MAKKPSQTSRLKALIKRYISKMGELAEEIKHADLDFGFLFYYPKGVTKNPNGKISYNGRSFQANKPKGEDFIIISHKTDISKEYIKYLESSKELRREVYDTLLRFFLLKNVGYNINQKKHLIITNQRIYPNTTGYISKSQFYNVISQILNCDYYSLMVIQKNCTGKVKDKALETGLERLYHI